MKEDVTSFGQTVMRGERKGLGGAKTTVAKGVAAANCDFGGGVDNWRLFAAMTVCSIPLGIVSLAVSFQSMVHWKGN